MSDCADFQWVNEGFLAGGSGGFSTLVASEGIQRGFWMRSMVKSHLSHV